MFNIYLTPPINRKVFYRCSVECNHLEIFTPLSLIIRFLFHYSAIASPCTVKKSVDDCNSNDIATSDMRFDTSQLESSLIDAMNRFQSNFHRTMVQLLQLASKCSVQIPVKHRFKEESIKRAESFVEAIDRYERGKDSVDLYDE
ncbi:hypothetical protein P879_05790 [Paragonimus westermani]|uniref:Uncharacterized protein n=1 Tax=Paragonimus westermani TaxID=34504 RepID=A0A8T0DBW3_9TREM|nr:hypothetical protein P879_05790 [Paragonimus westermani]